LHKTLQDNIQKQIKA
jgi:hypothetical protein